MFCEVSPSIEWWFVLHYIEGDQVFETSEAVKDELKKHIKDFEISDSFLMNPKWVEELCSDNKLIAAYNRAKKYNKTSENQMSIWKVMEEIGLLAKIYNEVEYRKAQLHLLIEHPSSISL